MYFKKGQMTLFVVLGIVILVAIGIGVYYSGIISKSIEEAKLAERKALTEEEKNVAKFVDDCVEKVLERGVVQVARNGGYYPPYEDHFVYLGFNVPVYLNKEEEILPKESELNKAIARFVDDNLEDCIGDSVNVLSKPKTKIRVSKNLIAEVEMQVMVKQSKLKSFSGSLNLDLSNYFEEIMDFYKHIKALKGTIETLELGRLAQEKEYEFYVDAIENSSLYFITWENILGEKPFIWSFAVTHGEYEEFPPELFPDLEEFTEEVLAEEDEVEEGDEIDEDDVDDGDDYDPESDEVPPSVEERLASFETYDYKKNISDADFDMLGEIIEEL